MRKKVFFALACVFGLTGCQSSSIEEVIPQQTKMVPLQFSLQMKKEIIPFSQTKSMPENTIPEPSTSKAGEDANEAELNELCSTIEYIVFKEEENPVFLKHKQYTYDPTNLDADFSCIYDSLPAGNYTFYFLGHNSQTATLSGTTFSFDNISDSFYKMLPLEIKVAEEVNQDVILQRIVSRIEFMATDPVHDNLKQFDMEVDGISNQFDLNTGEGIKATETQTFSYTFKEEEIGELNKIHSFYTFIPPTDNVLTARLSAIAKNDEIIRERHVSNITPEKNKIIRYRGRLYSCSESDDTFQISIYNNGKWEDTTDVELPEYE